MTTDPTQARTLLLTFFGPFPGVPVNPTVALAEGAQRLLTRMRPDLNVITRELPVSYDGSSTALRAALQDVQPDALISLGVAVGRDVVSLEQVAINLDSAGIEDNDGDQRCDEPIALAVRRRTSPPCRCAPALSVCVRRGIRSRFRTLPEPTCATMCSTRASASAVNWG